MIYWSKICIFCCFNFLHTPVSTEALARRGPWDLGLESWSQKNYSPWASRWQKLHDPMVFSFVSIPACDRRMDKDILPVAPAYLSVTKNHLL